jgi:tetratricopeptide (TPR) repeat protein
MPGLAHGQGSRLARGQSQSWRVLPRRAGLPGRRYRIIQRVLILSHSLPVRLLRFPVLCGALGVFMDWQALVGLLGCQEGNELLHRTALVLGACASIATIAAALYRLWRWVFGPSGRQRRAARALREQGELHARLNHTEQAMELYDFSARMNPGAAHVYFLRGCLKEHLEQINRAIADWKRCLLRHPNHSGAIQKLAQYGVRGAGSGWSSWAIAASAGAGVLVIFVLAGAFG